MGARKAIRAEKMKAEKKQKAIAVLRDLGDIYRTFRRSTGCVDRSFRIHNAGHCYCRTEYLHSSDHQAGRKRRVGVEVVWH